MSDPHPHRRSIELAIAEAMKSAKWVRCDGISVDAAFLIIRQVERRRDAAEIRPQGDELYQLVDEMCFATGFDSGRRRMYQLVLMAYYRIIKMRKAMLDRLRLMRRQHRF